MLCQALFLLWFLYRSHTCSKHVLDLSSDPGDYENNCYNLRLRHVLKHLRQLDLVLQLRRHEKQQCLILSRCEEKKDNYVYIYWLNVHAVGNMDYIPAHPFLLCCTHACVPSFLPLCVRYSYKTFPDKNYLFVYFLSQPYAADGTLKTKN